MKHFVSLLWVALIAVVCIPIALNLLCLTSVPLPVVGDGKLWLGFWGSYLGGIITVLSTIYVLYKNHDKDVKRKKYEDSNKRFEKLCEDLGELSSIINKDVFSFYLMNLKDPNSKEILQTMSLIGSLDEKIKVSYNVFCMKYAHCGGVEKDNFLEAYNHYAEVFRNCISDIQEAVVNKDVGIINDGQYLDEILKVCKKLESLGDITQDLFLRASLWKKKEWLDNEANRRQYILD